MRNPWVHIPIKSFATISAAHAVTSWGLEKAIVADHERMRKSGLRCATCLRTEKRRRRSATTCVSDPFFVMVQ